MDSTPDTVVIDGKTDKLRLLAYAYFMAQTVELRRVESVWHEILDLAKN